MLKSLQARLTLSYVVIILVCLVLIGLSALLLLRGYQRDLAFRRLEDRVVLASRLVGSEILRSRFTNPELIRWLAQEMNRGGGARVSVYLLDPSGQVIAGTDNRLDGQSFPDLALSNEPAPVWPARGARRIAQDIQLRYVAQPVLRPGLATAREASLVLLLAEPNRLVQGTAGDLLPRLVWAAAIALAISVVVAAVMAYSVSRPLERIARAAEQISAGHYDQQLDISAPREVASLAASFNAMARRVQATLQSQRDLVANVSHELKTPLTSIQGFSQALLDGTAAEPDARQRAATIIHEEAGRMRRLVDDLLDLAWLEAGQVTLAREPVDVAELLRGCAARLAPHAGQAGVAVEVNAAAALPAVMGDVDRLGQVFGNLLENAITHCAGASPGGRVALIAEQQDGTVVCSVTDNGRGIPADDLPRVFERFYQVDKSRARRGSRAGLGLAIAQEIVQAHDGRIGVESVEGLGTRFTVHLPACPAVPAGGPSTIKED